MLRRTDKKHSEEWRLSTALAKKNRRLITLLSALIVLWIVTVFGFAVCVSRIKNDNHRQTAFSFCDAGEVNVVYEKNIVP